MKNRGFSLVEALFSMILMAMILGLCAELMGGYAKVSRYSSLKEQSSISGVAALERMCTEISEATTLLNPTSAVQTGTVSFTRINPQPTSPPRLPVPLPAPLPATWVPNDATKYTMTVAYELTGQQLMRQVTFPDGSLSSLELATGVTGLSSSLLANGQVQISLSFLNYDSSFTVLNDTVSLNCINQ